MPQYLQKLRKIIRPFLIKHGRILLRYLESFDRMHVILVAFLIYSFFLLFTAFRYTVIDHTYYQNLADRQQMVEVKNAVSRGSIYSNNAPAGVFSTSTDLADLAVDPKEVGSKDRLESFLTDLVFEELCVKETPENCYSNLLGFLRVTELPDFAYTDEYVRGKIAAEVKNRTNKQWIDSVLVKESLPQDAVDAVNSLSLSGIYLSVNNLYADPTVIADSNAMATQLAPILGMKEVDVAKKLQKRPARYVKILKRLSFSTKEKLDTRIANETAQIKKGLLDEKDSIKNFLLLTPVPSRFYPEKKIGSQVIGFVDNLGEGRYGIEGYFNEELKGQQSVITSRKDTSGRVIGGYDLSKQKTVNGYDITLTIDRNIQQELEKLLAE